MSQLDKTQGTPTPNSHLAGVLPHPDLVGVSPPDPDLAGVPPPPQRTRDQWNYYGIEVGYPLNVDK